MLGHTSATAHTVCVVIAAVLFALAAFTGPWFGAPQPHPWYFGKLLAGGLFFLTLSTFFN